jgi:predicted  nucleic acid-binding Zn-ribbon protein
MQRSAEQAAAERAMREVSDVVTNLDHALTRAEEAHERVAKSGADANAELALEVAAGESRRVRKRLVQDTYYTGDSLRLL